MSDFEQARFNLADARRQKNDQQTALLRNVERLAQLDKHIETQQRKGNRRNNDDQDDDRLLERLLGEKKALKAKIKETQAAYLGSKIGVHQAYFTANLRASMMCESPAL